MLVDAHCHPYDLAKANPDIKYFFNSNEILAASSACSLDEFLFCEDMARNVPENEEPRHEGTGYLPSPVELHSGFNTLNKHPKGRGIKPLSTNKSQLFPCFGIHPQIFSQKTSHADASLEPKVRQRRDIFDEKYITDLLNILNTLAKEKKILAIGECGFDLYNTEFKETQALQNEVFALQTEIAVKHDLPLVLHVRRAMNKIFALTNILSKCKAVVFHSWSGTLDESLSLLRRGVNAYFSFGNTITLNHKQTIKSCAMLPAQRLLTETDAPYQPRRGESYSHWSNLPLILNAAAGLRTQAGNKTDAKELEQQLESNFRKIFCNF